MFTHLNSVITHRPEIYVNSDLKSPCKKDERENAKSEKYKRREREREKGRSKMERLLKASELNQGLCIVERQRAGNSRAFVGEVSL